jgi:hypothetical protein
VWDMKKHIILYWGSGATIFPEPLLILGFRCHHFEKHHVYTYTYLLSYSTATNIYNLRKPQVTISQSNFAQYIK